MSTLKRKAGVATAPDAKKPKQNGNIMSFFGGGQAAPGGSAKPSTTGSEPALRFDKKKWVAGLTAEQKELLQLEIDTMHDSWLAVLKDEVTTKEFLELKKFLAREDGAGKRIFPPPEDVYSWSRHTPFNTVKVVIVGQDPYHNVNQAHGLAFSVRPPTPAPPSLRNMYIALKNDYPKFEQPPRKGGLLTPWADRGVLLLNTCLTVRAHEANSHSNRGWERFTQRVIDLVAQKRTRGVVFMAWGTPAGKRVMKVDNTKHLVLKAVHPSPLSAARGFFTCGHFKKANEWLATRYGPTGEIDWSLDPKPESVAAEAEEEVKGAESTEGEVVVPEAAVVVTTADEKATNGSKSNGKDEETKTRADGESATEDEGDKEGSEHEEKDDE